MSRPKLFELPWRKRVRGSGAQPRRPAHFELSLLTEGAGTQIFSTTFVQWAAREALRRAQPITLYARFAPRQPGTVDAGAPDRSARQPALDPQGSLIDADMGAYYTWLNQQRLTGADESRFLVWFEDHSEAVVAASAFITEGNFFG